MYLRSTSAGERIRVLAVVAEVLVDRFAHHAQVLAQHGLARVLERLEIARHRDGEQHGDDAHHHEQFDQREAARACCYQSWYGTPFSPLPCASE